MNVQSITNNNNIIYKQNIITGGNRSMIDANVSSVADISQKESQNYVRRQSTDSTRTPHPHVDFRNSVTSYQHLSHLSQLPHTHNNNNNTFFNTTEKVQVLPTHPLISISLSKKHHHNATAISNNNLQYKSNDDNLLTNTKQKYNSTNYNLTTTTGTANENNNDNFLSLKDNTGKSKKRSSLDDLQQPKDKFKCLYLLVESALAVRQREEDNVYENATFMNLDDNDNDIVEEIINPEEEEEKEEEENVEILNSTTVENCSPKSEITIRKCVNVNTSHPNVQIKQIVDETVFLQNNNTTISETEMFSCHICQRYFQRKGSLENHIKIAHGSIDSEVAPKCSKCDKTFVNIASLRRHLRYVHGQTIYKCSKCLKDFDKWSEIHFHDCDMKANDVELIEITTSSNSDTNSSVKYTIECKTRHHCNDCNKHFSRIDTLNLHKKSAHGTDNNNLENPKIINGPQCSICKKEFGSLSSLSRHLRNVHSENYYTCELCHYTFSSRNLLKSHKCNDSFQYVDVTNPN